MDNIFTSITLDKLLIVNSCLAIIPTVVTNLITIKITNSIKHNYDKKIEDLKADLSFNIKKREASALVAELLAEWVSKPEKRTKLNKLLWEASLWLPDNETKELNKLLAHKGDIHMKEMLVKIRRIIQGCETTVTANDLTSFTDRTSE